MFKYRVIQASDHEHLVLEDTVGQIYLVRALGPPPQIGSRLDGARPHLGFGLLMCNMSGQVYRVMFESIRGRAAVVLKPEQKTA